MSRMDKAPKEPPQAAQHSKKRSYLSQADVPSMSLARALRIPKALAEQYGKQPATPVEVATALEMSPTSGPFRALTGASIAYGFTEGGYNAEFISLTPLGMRVVAPTVEIDDEAAMREAFMRPRVLREFLQKYDGSPLPSPVIAKNVLESMGVPGEKATATFDLIVEGADELGFLLTSKDKKYVNLRTRLRAVEPVEQATPEDEDTLDEPDEPQPAAHGAPDDPTPPSPAALALPERNRKVFVSHGSNRKIVDQLKSMLEYGEFEPVVSVERETTAKPVPKKVFEDMNECGAGIIHVAKEKTLIDSDGNEHHVLNENVLIEIGGAMALWGDNFILLVEEGTKLPSNLQGMYEVRYQGTTLDADATMRLLKAFKSFKS